MTHQATLAHIEAAQARIDGLAMNVNFADLLAEKAEALGDKTGVHFFQSDEKLSYRELDEKTDKLADALMKMGVRKGSHVALVTPNSSGFVLSWFAIAKLGAVMVPINPTYTARELTYVLSDSDASFLVYEPMFEAVLEAVASILKAEGIKPSPTAVFAASLSSLERTDTEASPETSAAMLTVLGVALEHAPTGPVLSRRFSNRRLYSRYGGL